MHGGAEHSHALVGRQLLHGAHGCALLGHHFRGLVMMSDLAARTHGQPGPGVRMSRKCKAKLPQAAPAMGLLIAFRTIPCMAG